MVTENPSPYQPPGLSGTGEQGSAQKPEPSQTPRTASRFVPMFLAAFVGSLPLFVFFVLVNVWWDGVNGLPYLRFFSQFAFVSAIASALIVVALCLVRFRSSLVAFVLGCLWPVLLVLGLVVYTVATVN